MNYYKYVKRAIDFLTAILLLVLLSGILLLIMLTYGLLGERPIFFKSLRSGKNNTPFWILKFRTLSTDEKKSLQERQFPLGNVLRKTNLDELPQLWNVMKGEMSLIGPRPLPIEYGSLLSDEQSKRYKVKPGITGWAQVNGRHSISWQKKFELDLYYISHVSFYLDMRILFKTIVLLLSFRKDRSLEEEKFKGN
jgi:lipopolysaccharide/colanic/teichoic acid biosynthesis glycosyltransferase